MRSLLTALFFSSLSVLTSCQTTTPYQKTDTEPTIAGLESGIDDLGNQITENFAEGQEPILIVLDFADEEGRITGLGRFLAEELLHYLHQDKKWRVIERRYLDKTMKEIRFGMSGLVEDETAKSVGKIVGADAILTGSYIQLGGKVKVQSRIVEVETGNILATGSIQIQKSEVASLMRQVIEDTSRTHEGDHFLLRQKLANPTQSELITSEGISTIRAGDLDHARKNALDDALRKAAEQGIRTAVASISPDASEPVLPERILNETRGYVRSYKIIGERSEGNLLRLTVSAEVAIGNLNQDLAAIGILLEQKHNPRVMVLIAEKNVSQDHYALSWKDPSPDENLSVAENTLMNKLSEKGFVLVDISGISRAIHQLEKNGPSFSSADLSMNQARAIGKKLDAEVVIIGKAKASKAGSFKNMRDLKMVSVQARLSARALRTDTGEVIASATTVQPAIHINEDTAGVKALEKAASQLADKITDQILAKFQSEVQGTTSIQMIVVGLRHKQLIRFKSNMKSKFRKIKSIHQRSYEGNVAILDIKFNGNTNMMADEISEASFRDFDVQVTSVTPNTVKTRVSQK